MLYSCHSHNLGPARAMLIELTGSTVHECRRSGCMYVYTTVVKSIAALLWLPEPHEQLLD